MAIAHARPPVVHCSRQDQEPFMTFAFQHHHGAMLLKYSGISFISGAVNHGFFSGERSLWTAAAGMV